MCLVLFLEIMARFSFTTRACTILAFAAIYIIWGSTYLAIRFTLETLPPLLTAGTRFFLAGAILYGCIRIRRRVSAPTGKHWLASFIVGGLLLLGGNGAVVLAEQTFPSGLASLFIAIVPLLMVLIEWLMFQGERPSFNVFTGIAVGIFGVVLLIMPAFCHVAGMQWDGKGVLLLIGAALSWSFGSVFARRVAQHKEILLSAGMQMIAGGLLLFFVGVCRGELFTVHFTVFSIRSVGAFFYLIVFGSLIGFSSYIWLLKNAGTARASTYAFVNPLVAVFLGWWLAGEIVSSVTLLAAAMVITAVGIITFDQINDQDTIDLKKI